MQKVRLFFIVSVLMLPIQLNCWGWDDVKKDLKKAADKTKDLAQSAWDHTTSQYVTFKYNSNYNLGIKNMAIELLYPSGKTETIHLIKNGNAVAIHSHDNTSRLFGNLSSGPTSSLSSDLLSNQSQNSNSELFFKLAYNQEGSGTAPELLVSSQEKITTTNYNYNNSSSGSGYSSSSTTRFIGSCQFFLKPESEAPKSYKVIVNGKSTSSVPMFRKFYIDIQ